MEDRLFQHRASEIVSLCTAMTAAQLQEVIDDVNDLFTAQEQAEEEQAASEKGVR